MTNLVFVPFNEVFQYFDKSEREHIHTLVTRYRRLVLNKHQLSKKALEELDALQWVLNLLMELEDSD